jgi:hypothetical protein
VLTVAIAAGTGAMIHNLSGPDYGNDFRGVQDAAIRILHGADPYVGRTAHQLLVTNNPYVLPPLLAELTSPLTALPFGVALAIFDLVCVVALVGALRLLEIRDPWIYVIALFSLPFVDSLWIGQPEGLFALALALAWRGRHGRAAPIAVGLVVASKLVLWPLLLWLLVSRRRSAAILGAATALIVLAISWAAIGFHGLTGYLHRLALDGRAFDQRSHSIAAVALRLGLGQTVAVALGMAAGALIAGSLARYAGRRELGIFTATVLGGLLFSPLLWTHYLVVLFVPMAVARRRFDWLWMSTVLWYASPAEPAAHVWQIALVPGLAVFLAGDAVRRTRRQAAA